MTWLVEWASIFTWHSFPQWGGRKSGKPIAIVGKSQVTDAQSLSLPRPDTTEVK
jgi:hypothetical protein